MRLMAREAHIIRSCVYTWRLIKPLRLNLQKIDVHTEQFCE